MSINVLVSLLQHLAIVNTVFTVIIGDSHCSLLALNNLQYGTSIFNFPNNSQFQFFLSSPRSRIDRIAYTRTMHLSLRGLYRSCWKALFCGFHVRISCAVLLFVQCGPGAYQQVTPKECVALRSCYRRRVYTFLDLTHAVHEKNV